MSELHATQLAGCFGVSCLVHDDNRGELRKPFERTWLDERGIDFNVHEVVWTISQKDVIRGLHFQLPPAASDKFVWCAHGHVTDVVVDLRVDQPTYGTYVSFELGDGGIDAVFVPRGCAHGFASRVDGSLVSYLISTPFSPGLDAGIRWDSVDIDWGVEVPIISDRDQTLPSLRDLSSPF